MQGLINGFTKEDGLSHGHDKRDELRTDAEQNVAKFIELAKQLETFFLQRRFQLSVLKPEQIIKEVNLLNTSYSDAAWSHYDTYSHHRTVLN